MSKIDNSIYLADILNSAKEIKDFVEGKSFADFDVDRQCVLAVIKSLEIIGEATKNLSKELRHRHPDIPWKDMAGLRDVLVHRYRDADNEVIFSIACQAIPSLIPKIEKVVATISKEQRKQHPTS